MRLLILAFITSTFTTSSTANCGGNFDIFTIDLKLEALSMGYSENSIQRFFKNVKKLCDEARKLSFLFKLVDAVKNTFLVKTKNVRI